MSSHFNCINYVDVQNNVETIRIILDSSSDEEPLICSRKRVGDEGKTIRRSPLLTHDV